MKFKYLVEIIKDIITIVNYLINIYNSYLK